MEEGAAVPPDNGIEAQPLSHAAVLGLRALGDAKLILGGGRMQ